MSPPESVGRSSPLFWEDLKKPDSAAVTILPDLQHCLFCVSGEVPESLLFSH